MSETGQATTPAESDPLLGTKVGNYKLVRRLGVGGMGAVYEAVHELMGKKAAVKMLLPELSANQEIVGRFFNEAKASTRIQHPGIVDVYDFGYHQTGHAYIVMEFLAGSSLTDLMKQGLRFPRALDIAWQLASALGAAHKNGIVHRDVKPDNVFIVPDPATPTGDRVKVLDFGIAKLSGDEGMTSKTRTGTVMGTPVYMSPEQCKGSGEVDHRTDIYALGCIMFEMVCGRPPFVKNGFGELITAHIIEEPPRPSEFNPSVPALYEAIVMRTLEKDLEARYQSTAEIEADLGSINPDAVGDVAVAPAVGHAGGTGRSKLRSAGGARGRTRAGAGPGLDTKLKLTATEISAPEEDALAAAARRKKVVLVAGAGGAAVVVLGLVLALGGGDKSPEAPLPAAAAPPAEPAAPAEPRQVTLTVRSQPSGASVLRAEDEFFLGKTPLARPFPAGTGEARFIVRAPGHQDQRVALPLLQDGAVDVDLQPVAAHADTPGGERAAPPAKGTAKNKGGPPAERGSKKKRDWGELADF